MSNDSSGHVFPPLTRWLTAISFCWIFQLRHADAISPFFGGASTRPTDAQSHLRAEMTAELLLMAVGRHTYFLDGLMKPQPYDEDGADEATDQRQHMQAAIALHLLQQLRFMEAMDEKLTATAAETAVSVLEYRTAMQVFFETLQRKVEQDGAMLAAFMDAEAHVRNWYRGLPATRKRYTSVRTVSAPILLRVLSRQSTFVRRLAVCTLFLETAREGDEHPHSKMARNVLRLVRNRDAAALIERIFQAAVDETVADAQNGPQDVQRTLDVLFQKLIDRMRRDVDLNSQAIRAKLCAD